MFGILDTLIVRPIVNILFIIYSLVGDFGLAIIIFTIIVKFAMWPLMKRQLHQTRVMREIQPELAEIKKNCNGNRQMESLQMMDLYKRKNVKPFRSMLSVFIQLASKKIRHKKVFLSSPLHHHFQALGWPEAKIVMRFWVISAMGSVLGLIIFLIDRKW